MQEQLEVRAERIYSGHHVDLPMLQPGMKASYPLPGKLTSKDYGLVTRVNFTTNTSTSDLATRGMWEYYSDALGDSLGKIASEYLDDQSIKWSNQRPQVNPGEVYELVVYKSPRIGLARRIAALVEGEKLEQPKPEKQRVFANVLTQATLADNSIVYLAGPDGREVYVASLNDLLRQKQISQKIPEQNIS